METGKYFESNHKKLQSIPDVDHQWAVAIDKCRDHVRFRLKKRTLYGAHTNERLGMNPLDYYLCYAYDAILSGNWEWKNKYSLSEQMVVIVESTLSTEVEKTKTTKAIQNKTVSGDDDDLFYKMEDVSTEVDMAHEILFETQVSVIEEEIKGDGDLEILWDCVKEGMKRADIAEFMEKTPKQFDKLRERFIMKIKNSSFFEFEQ